MPTEQTADAGKSSLRKYYAKLRESMSAADRRTKSQKIAEHLLQFVVECKDKRSHHGCDCGPFMIGLYSAFRGEADIANAILRLQAMGHKVAYPKTDKQNKGLSFFQVSRLDELVPGNYGIYEPSKSTDEQVNPEEVDIVCVPGLAFTREGIRLGYGGGYYDRFFAHVCEKAIRVGTVYDVQVAGALPAFRHDIRMDYLMTEEGWNACQP